MATPGVNPEVFRLGPISQAVKKKASPKQWKRIVKDAHTKGFTVESYLDRSVPDAYKSRTQTSIRKQATSTVATAYQPAEKALDDREARLKAVQDKRAKDNEFYRDWLAKSTAAMQASSDTATQMLRDSGKQLHDDQIANYQQSLQSAADRAMQQPGNVSSREEIVKALETTPEFERGLSLINNQRAEIERVGSTRSTHRAAQSANVLATQAAREAAQASETFKALGEVAEGRSKLAFERGAATADEISRLLNQELDKAGANRDFGALASKLNIQQDTLDLKALVAEANIADDNADNANDAATLRETQRRNRVLEGIASAKLGQSDARLRLDWYKAKKAAAEAKGGKGKGGTKYEDSAEGRYYTGYATLASTRVNGGKDPLRPSQVAKNPASWENRLMAEGYTQAMARKIVRAFIGGRNGDRAGAPPAYDQKRDPKPRG